MTSPSLLETSVNFVTFIILSSCWGKSSDVSVPFEKTVVSSKILPSVAEFISSAISIGNWLISNLEIESALFHAPGQCTTVMLN